MSGGFFDYVQWNISRIAEDIENLIETPDNYTPEELKIFKEAIYNLKRAFIYANRIDYFLSNDNGTDAFMSRLKVELNFLDKMYKEQC